VSGTWRWSQNTDGHNEVTTTQTLLYKRVVSGQLHGQRLISKHAITVSGKFVGESGFHCLDLDIDRFTLLTRDGAQFSHMGSTDETLLKPIHQLRLQSENYAAQPEIGCDAADGTVLYISG